MYKHNKEGFTLIEYATAMTLLGIILLGGMAFYFYSDRHLQAAFHRRVATELANAELEEIRKNGYNSLTNPANGLWQGPITVNVRDLPAEQNIYVYDIDDNGDSATDYKQVIVEVAWQDPDKTYKQEVSLNTHIAP